MKKLTFVLTLLLTVLLSISCAEEAKVAPTAVVENTATAVPPTKTAAPTATAAPLLPLVVSSKPEVGEELSLDAPIEITFDQPMNRASVEKAFAIEPGASVDGTFAWLNDQTMRFTLKKGFQRDQRYKIRVVETAQSSKGESLDRPFEMWFSTVGSLAVTNVQPTDKSREIMADSIVTVVFNRPVVSLSAIEDLGSLPDPLTFNPPIIGQGKWLNTAIYQFAPAKGFLPSTEYTARIAKGLTDSVGQATLEDDFEWTFTTVTPAVIGTIPKSGNKFVSDTPIISMTFNQPMNHRNVEQNFSLIKSKPKTGQSISGKFSWNGSMAQPMEENQDNYYDETSEGKGPSTIGKETVEFRPNEPLELGETYQIELPKGTQGMMSELAKTKDDFKATFTVIPAPKIFRTNPESGSEAVDPWQSVEFSFNSPMNRDSVIFNKNLFIQPTVAATEVYTYWSGNSTELNINFPLQVSSHYTVTVGAGLTGRYGHELTTSTTITWATRAAEPSVYLHAPDRVALYNAYTDTLVFASVRNISQVNFSLYRMNQNDFMKVMGDWETWQSYTPAKTDLLAEWEQKTTSKLNSTLIYRVNLGERSGKEGSLSPGLYYLKVFPPESVYPQDAYNMQGKLILVVSKYNLTLKSSPSEMLAWLTDLKTGQPVKQVPLEFYLYNNDKTAQKVGQGQTNSDGLALTTYTESNNYTRYAFAEMGKDFAVASSEWESGIAPYYFNEVQVEDTQSSTNAHFYTDRPIYRPGQTVYFKGIIRADDDAHYSLPTSPTATLKVFDSQSKEIFNQELRLSKMGTVNGAIQLDENAVLGSYSLQVAYEGHDFNKDFLVSAYRKPEYLVSVTTDKPEYLTGETVKVVADAQFFSGGPVSNAKVKWTLLTDDFYFRYQGKGWYDFSDYDSSRRNVDDYYQGGGYKIAEGEGVTDKDGRFMFESKADIADKLSSQQITFDVVIEDINNQTVASQARATVHKGLVYVGLRPEQYVGVTGKESPINVLVVDWESQPVASQTVQVVFAEHNWYSVKRQYDNGEFYWDSVVEDVPVFTTTVTTNKEGLVQAKFMPDKGGIYKIFATATDRKGHEVQSSTFMWVSGHEYVNWRQENNDRLDLVADQREYKVGDTATILVPHPYNGAVKALVTLERGHIYSHTVMTLPTNSEQLKIPITEDMIPNMYVSVVVVEGESPNPHLDESKQPVGLPSFKIGYASLPIKVAEKQLNIILTPNKSAEEKYHPGEKAEYKVNVTNWRGEPVQAELSLALVDKAVLSLQPEAPGQLSANFWRTRGLAIHTAGGLTLAIDRINMLVAPEAKGGGGGFDIGFGDIRGDFRETALWVADFLTDKQGQGTIQATLPDNLTTWTMTGKGVTGADTLVGESTVEIISSKPLLVRPVAPRFLVMGDEARMGMIVQNNSKQDLTVETRFEATNVTVKPLGDSSVALKAGERVKVEYLVTVPSNLVDKDPVVKLTMGAKAQDFGDAMTFEIPLYHSSTPETVATAGMLDKDGSRTETIALPRSFDKTQGDLTINVDGSLAAGMRDGLNYLEHFPYECTEQTVSRFLPNVVTYRAYKALKMNNPELAKKLPGLVSVGLQRLYNQQHYDGGWGWWLTDQSNPNLTAYVLLSLIEAQRAEFSVDQQVINNGVDFLKKSLITPTDVTSSWRANRQAFILYVLAEAGSGDLGRSKTLFKRREQLDLFGRAYLAMAMYKIDSKAKEVDTLIDDLTSEAIVSATGAHWEEKQVDYYAMNTDTRSTAIVIAALSTIQPDHALLPGAVRWLMNIREHGGHWETTQETAWSIIGLTDWMIATKELEGNYAWQISLNGKSIGQGKVGADNIDQTTQLRVEVSKLLENVGSLNRFSIQRNPLEGTAASAGRLYYAAYLTYYKPVEEVKALNRGIIVSRQYHLVQTSEVSETSEVLAKSISEANLGDTIEVKLTIIAPNDLHYVLVEDPIPAGTEGIDQSLAIASVVGESPELKRTDRRNPWGHGYGWWYFSHSELRDDKAVLFATYLPRGTYEYTYYVRASLPGKYRVRPTLASEMYFPEVFGRSDGGVFRVKE